METLAAVIALAALQAAAFLIVTRLPLSVQRKAAEHGRYANLALEHGFERTSGGTMRLVHA